MASVREELIDELVNSELECSRDRAEKAVDRAIAANAVNIDPEDDETQISATADMIYDNSEYWED